MLWCVKLLGGTVAGSVASNGRAVAPIRSGRNVYSPRITTSEPCDIRVTDMTAQVPTSIRLSPANPVIQQADQAEADSDKSTVAEYANLSNSFPDFRLVAIRRADVERSQPLTSQQLRDENCGDTCLREDEEDRLVVAYRSL